MAHAASSKSLRVALVLAFFACAVTGCSSSGPPATAKAAARRLGSYGVTALIPAGWHRVGVRHLPGAIVPLQVASFPADGSVRTICDPNSIARQIPAGGALLQIIQDSGPYSRRRQLPGAVSPSGPPGDYRPLANPFRLGPSQSHECGEAYNVFFRKGGPREGLRVLQLRIWTTPGGINGSVRRQIEALMQSLRVRPS